MLALDMGMGKTLCVVAAHALEQHTLPDAPTMHTEHSKAALGKVAAKVYVGRRYPDEPDREKLKEVEMHTGALVSPTSSALTAVATSGLRSPRCLPVNAHCPFVRESADWGLHLTCAALAGFEQADDGYGTIVPDGSVRVWHCHLLFAAGTWLQMTTASTAAQLHSSTTCH